MENQKVKMKFRDCDGVVREEELDLLEVNGAENLFMDFYYSYNMTSDDLVSIEIPEGIETLKEWAFTNLGTLETVVLPKTLKVINELAFEDCWALKMPELPPTLKVVYPNAFQTIFGSTIVLPKTLELFSGDSFGSAKLILDPQSPYFYQDDDGVIYTKDKKEVVWVPFDKEVIEIADGTTFIQSGAFNCRKYLKTVKLPESLKEIESFAFEGCEKLESFNIPSKVTSLNESVFSDCYNLTEFNIGPNISIIGDNAFSNCFQIKQIVIPKTVKELAYCTFEDWEEDQTIIIESKDCINSQNLATVAKVVFMN